MLGVAARRGARGLEKSVVYSQPQKNPVPRKIPAFAHALGPALICTRLRFSFDSPREHMGGTSIEYIRSRLEKAGRVDLLGAIERGEISTYAAGEAAGFFKRPPVLGTGSPNEAKRRRHQLSQAAHVERPSELDADKLSSDQRTFLLYGPDDRCGDAFDTEGQVEAAWEKHKERILADYAVGRRPWAWRVFDRPDLPWKGYDRERAINWRAANVLTPEEKVQLEAQWRKDFEVGRDLKSADIPTELVKEWTAERRQQRLARTSTAQCVR